MVAHEAALAAKLHAKDEEVEKLVAEQTQELKQEHKKALDALALDHAGKLKEVIDRAAATKATRIELAGKVEKLEADLARLTQEISMLKDDKEKALYDLAEMHTTISDKTKLLSTANEPLTI